MRGRSHDGARLPLRSGGDSGGPGQQRRLPSLPRSCHEQLPRLSRARNTRRSSTQPYVRSGSRRSVGIGDDGLLVEATFDEVVLGGGDNNHNVELLVARSEASVLTVIVVANRQGLRAGGQISLARRRGQALIARARTKS